MHMDGLEYMLGTILGNIDGYEERMTGLIQALTLLKYLNWKYPW